MTEEQRKVFLERATELAKECDEAMRLGQGIFANESCIRLCELVTMARLLGCELFFDHETKKYEIVEIKK